MPSVYLLFIKMYGICQKLIGITLYLTTNHIHVSIKTYAQSVIFITLFLRRLSVKKLKQDVQTTHIYLLDER